MVGAFSCHDGCLSVMRARELPVAGSVTISSTVSWRRGARNQRSASPIGDQRTPYTYWSVDGPTSTFVRVFAARSWISRRATGFGSPGFG